MLYFDIIFKLLLFLLVHLLFGTSEGK